LSQWFPSDNRAKAMSYFYIAAALASVIGLPLSGALLELHGVFGFAGWRWLYLIEGIPALILGFVVLKHLPDNIQAAKWLLPEQRKWLSNVITDELKMRGEKKGDKLYSIFSNKHVWLLSFFWLLQAFGTIGITLFLPQILKNISGGTDFIISLLSALPFLFACIFMYFNSKSSDISGERQLHLGLPLLVSGFLLILSIYTGITVTYVLLVASVALNWAVTPVFWAVTTEYLSSGSVAAGSIAMINAIANIAGATLPYLMGYIRDVTGNYDYALWMVGVALVLGGLLGISIAQKVALNRLVVVQETSK
jgi:MFS transporter, ACS family, tartrate transporter